MRPASWCAAVVACLLVSVGFAVAQAGGPGEGRPPGEAAPPEVIFDYPHADLRGGLVLQGGCEEAPTMVSLDITSVATSSGETANFPIVLGGMDDWQVVPPLPDYLLGTYTVGSLVGSSANFLFGTPRPGPTVAVTELGQVYTLSVEVVPTTARMEGVVVDQSGKPLGGGTVRLSGQDGLTYTGFISSGGTFVIELIGMGDARRGAEDDFEAVVTAGDAEGQCDEFRTTVHLKAGVTDRSGFVIEAQGAVSGTIVDSEGAPVKGAHIELSRRDGRRFTTTTSQTGFYQLEDIPEGLSTVTATCPKQNRSQSQEIDIKCDQRGYQRADFTLPCGCKVAGFVRRPDGEAVDQASVTLQPAAGETASTTTAASGRYAFSQVPPGKATITATCPQGQPSRAVSVDVTCPEEGQDVPLTLNCGPAADFHLLHTATAVGDCTFSRTEIRMKGETVFSFPSGADTVELLVPYLTTFRIEGKSGPGGSIAFSPGSFTAGATVRWIVRRTREKGRDCLRAELETVEEKDQPLHITIRNEDGDIVTEYDVTQPALAAPGFVPIAGRRESCGDQGPGGPRIEEKMDRSIAPLCVAPPTVAALVTGESRITEQILVSPLRVAPGGEPPNP
jgi:hypothetical protein